MRCNECGADIERGILTFWIHADRETRDHRATPVHACEARLWNGSGRTFCRTEGCSRVPALSETYAD